MKEPQIIYEDGDVLVINKPAGLIVHSDGRTVESSVAEWVVEHYPHTRGVGEPWLSPQGETVDRPGIVHRLDRTTSGIMIIAKTSEAHAFLKKQFQSRTLSKEYRAFVYGHPKENTGTVELEIERVRSVPPRWGVKKVSAHTAEEKKSRAAVTDWEVLERGTDKETGDKVSLVAVRPKTGRTHQIRVHMQAINHPIVCDPLYAKGKVCLLGFARPALHARSLSVVLPNGTSRTFEVPLPEDFLVAEKQLQK